MNNRIDPTSVHPTSIRTQVHMDMILERDRMIRGLKGVVVAFGIIMITELILIVLLIWRHHE